MSSRRNFLDADNSIMERNLRFVKNDFEENLNQYFGGSGSRDNNTTNVAIPPRDYKVVQPKPGDSHVHSHLNNFEKRRSFLLQLGLVRHEAYELAKNIDFNVNHYEEKRQQWMSRGVRRDEVNDRILCCIRNEQNWNDDNAHREEIPSPPRISRWFQKQDTFQYNYRDYSGIIENRPPRSRSRSPSRPSSQRNEHREEYYQRIRSHSSNRRFSPLVEKKGEEYFSRQDNFRDDERRDHYSPVRSNDREKRYRLSRSRSPFGAFHTIDERQSNEYFMQCNNSRGEVRRDISRKRSRSYSPARINFREEHYRSQRSRSPNRGFSEKQPEEYIVQHHKYTDNTKRNIVREESHSRSYPPSRDHREERNRLSKSRSPNRDLDRKIEEYFLQHENFRNEVRRDTMRERSRSYSPRHDHIEKECYQLRSPMKRFNEGHPEGYFPQQENFRDTFDERSYSRPYSPPRHKHKEVICHSSRSRSPNRDFNSMNKGSNEDISSQRIHFRGDVRSNTNYFNNLQESSSNNITSQFHDVKNNNEFGNSQNGSRNMSQQYFNNPRESLSSNIGFQCQGVKNNNEFGNGQNGSRSTRNISQQYFSNPRENSSNNTGFQSHDFKNNNEFGNSSRNSRNMSQQCFNNPRESSFSNTVGKNNNQFGNDEKGPRNSRNMPQHLVSTIQNREIPTIRTLDKFSNQTQTLSNRDVSSLVPLQKFPNRNDDQQPSTSAWGSHYNPNANKILPLQDNKKSIKIRDIKKIRQNRKKIFTERNIPEAPIIKSALKEPKGGHLKANPQDYWSQWWPQFKYIECSIPEIDPNDFDVKPSLNFMIKPNTPKFRVRKHYLLQKGVRALEKIQTINEENYHIRNVYKLFLSKKHLEDPNFQNVLTPHELNCIAPVLRNCQIKTKMALTHQSLIVRWHNCLHVKTRCTRNLFNDKCFHYLVMESIQELKKMCQQDWPQFPEFYKQLKSTKIDIYNFRVNKNNNKNNNNLEVKQEQEEDDEDEDDDDEDDDEDGNGDDNSS